MCTKNASKKLLCTLAILSDFVKKARKVSKDVERLTVFRYFAKERQNYLFKITYILPVDFGIINPIKRSIISYE